MTAKRTRECDRWSTGLEPDLYHQVLCPSATKSFAWYYNVLSLQQSNGLNGSASDDFGSHGYRARHCRIHGAWIARPTRSGHMLLRSTKGCSYGLCVNGKTTSPHIYGRSLTTAAGCGGTFRRLDL